MKQLLFLPLLALLCWQCNRNPTPPSPASVETAAANVQRLTHLEMANQLRKDTNAALQPLTYKSLSPAAAKALLAENDIAALVVNSYPDNGFYGDNRYRIEFIITEMKPLADHPLQFAVKGKNRYKKTISAFEGVLDIQRVAEFEDKNLDTTEVMRFADEIINFGKGYTLQGRFNFKEDSLLSSSGQFTGDFTMEFFTAGEEDGGEPGPQLWFCSSNSPSEGSGYRFVGNWTGFKNPAVQKPVIWSRDLFRFANNILQDFSYGEREVVINPKYRALGWDTYWTGEEWWNDSPGESK